jgi:hypothetical protein
VRPFDGPKSAKVRDQVVDALGDEVEVVSTREVQQAADKLEADSSSAEGRVAISRELEIDAWIEGRVSKQGRNWLLTLSVASGDDGGMNEVGDIKAAQPPALARRAGSQAWDTISGAVGQARRPQQEVAAPIEEEPEPIARADKPAAEEEEEEEEPEEEMEPEGDDGEGERPMALAIDLGLGGFSRDFDYRQNLSALPTYDIAAPPFARLGLEWFPAAHFSTGALAHVGLRAAGQMAFGLSSSPESGMTTDFSTSSSLFELGVRGRLPLGGFQLAADVSYGVHNYTIDSASANNVAIDPLIPSAGYSYVRLGIDAKLALGDSASIGAGLALMPLLGLGEVETWFPQASGLAMEGNLSFAYALLDSLDLMISLAARRYAITLEPTVNDATIGRPVAGGIVDQYFAGQIGLRVRLGGTP